MRTSWRRRRAQADFSPGPARIDSLTLAFALEGVHALELGRRSRPDLLSVSLSTTDAFGPDSREIHPASDWNAELWRHMIPPDYGWLFCAVTSPGYVWSAAGLDAEHGSTNPDDVTVPIVFYGEGIPAQRVLDHHNFSEAHP